MEIPWKFLGIHVFVFITVGTANDNQHLEQAKHKLDIGHPHTVTSFSPLSVKYGGTNDALWKPWLRQTENYVTGRQHIQ